MTVRRMGVAERRARLAERHHLAPAARAAQGQGSAADAVAGVAGDLIGLHGTDPASVYLALWARTAGIGSAAIEEALYEERVLVRMLGMRRTMFVVPVRSADLIQAACTDEIALRLRRRLADMLSKVAVADDVDGWLEEVCDATVAALTGLGSATGAELAKAEPRLGLEITYAEDKSYGGSVRISSQTLMLLSAQGRIVRGRPRGGRTPTQFQWHLPEAWLGDGAAGGYESAAQARTELARRWLLAFGPAPVSDLQWWSGWTGGQTKAALAGLDIAEVDLDGRPGVMLAVDTPDGPGLTADAGPSGRPAGDHGQGTAGQPWAAAGQPWAALLPALDPTPMGWKDRDWFVGEHTPGLFDRSGNIGPTVWWAGRIVGGWAQRKDGEIVYRLLEDVGAEARAAIATRAGELGQWLGLVRVTPRFRTPLERELAA